MMTDCISTKRETVWQYRKWRHMHNTCFFFFPVHHTRAGSEDKKYRAVKHESQDRIVFWPQRTVKNSNLHHLHLKDLTVSGEKQMWNVERKEKHFYGNGYS